MCPLCGLSQLAKEEMCKLSPEFCFAYTTPGTEVTLYLTGKLFLFWWLQTSNLWSSSLPWQGWETELSKVGESFRFVLFFVRVYNERIRLYFPTDVHIFKGSLFHLIWLLSKEQVSLPCYCPWLRHKKEKWDRETERKQLICGLLLFFQTRKKKWIKNPTYCFQEGPTFLY